jgi:hypothetical protein
MDSFGLLRRYGVEKRPTFKKSADGFVIESGVEFGLLMEVFSLSMARLEDNYDTSSTISCNFDGMKYRISDIFREVKELIPHIRSLEYADMRFCIH